MKKEKARLHELRAMPYEEYRLTPEWQKTRKLALRRAEGRCQECDAENVDLEIYHLNGDNIGCEQESDVIALCVECFNQINGGPSLEVPHVSLRHRLTIYGPAALVSVGIPAILHAPLPAELGALGAVIFLAIKCPAIYATVKRGLPPWVVEFIDSRAERAEQRRQSGEWSILDRVMGRHLQGAPIDDLSDEEFAAYLQAHGITDEAAADYISPSSGGEKSLLPQTVFEVPARARVVSEDAIRELEQCLNDVLSGFQVYADVRPELTEVGPHIIRLGVVPTGIPEIGEDDNPKLDDAGDVVYSRRTSIGEISKREKDIQLALGTTSIRMLLPVPGRKYVGIEIPNPCPATVTIAEVLTSREYQQAAASSKLVFALGRDVSGRVYVCDIAKAPHILIGGSTGGGKSVLLNVLIASLLSNATPDDVRMLMVDPKVVELSPYNGVAHLLKPVVTDMTLVPPLLDEAINEAQRRYQAFAQVGVRNLESYRRKRAVMPQLENFPAWVIIIDEFAELMMTAPEETEDRVIRLAQMARATGMHLVITTQKPVVKVVTGLIKGNLPVSIALKTKTEGDSQVILGHGGASRLLGNGDMLYLPPDAGEPIRIQGAFMTDEEAEAVAARWQMGGKPHRSDGDRTLEVSNQKLDVDTLVSWLTEGRVNHQQFLTLMDQISGRVTDDLDEDQVFASGRMLGESGRVVLKRDDGVGRTRTGVAQNGGFSPEIGVFGDLGDLDGADTEKAVNELVDGLGGSPTIRPMHPRMNAEQTERFKILYPYLGKERALDEIPGCNHRHRQHAQEIIDQFGLKRINVK